MSLDGPAKRIITIPFPAAAIMIAVDGGVEHVVGMHEFSWTAARDGVLGSFFPNVKDVKHDLASEGFAPNLESILALEPDLVVQWSSQGDELITPLDGAGLNVMGVEYGTIDDVAQWLTMFSTALGKPERGVEMAARLKADLGNEKARGLKRSGKQPSVLYFNRFVEGLKVAGAGTLNNDYITLVGASNAAAEVKGLVDVDLEQVLSWDPDIILLGNFDAALPDDVYGDKRWKDVSAVTSKRVYKVPLGGYRWDPPSHESPLMWRWLSQIAYPDGTDGGLHDKVLDDYGFFYGQKPTQTQLSSILWAEVNSVSADYEPFDKL
ncbi:MAG: ABC transporter substrate-binding protein [Aeromicrobium sp.]